METVNPVLAKKIGRMPDTGRADEQEAPDSPMRKMRRALGRAADKAAGLSASVLGIAAAADDAEGLVENGPEGWVVLGLRDGASAGLSGFFLLDQVLRSALVEMQTIGSLLPVASEQRPVTSTDAAMCIPFATALLCELSEAGFGDEGFDPAAFDIGPMDDLRTAGLVMLQGHYLSWRVTIQLGGDIQGELMIAVKPAVSPADAGGSSNEAWAHDLRRAVEDAPAELDAIIARLTYPVHKIERFEVGQVLTLPGTTVGSVLLTGPGGEEVSAGRLGQVAGKRAVRIEEPRIELQESNPVTPAAPRPAGLPQDEAALSIAGAEMP